MRVKTLKAHTIKADGEESEKAVGDVYDLVPAAAVSAIRDGIVEAVEEKPAPAPAKLPRTQPPKPAS